MERPKSIASSEAGLSRRGFLGSAAIFSVAALTPELLAGCTNNGPSKPNSGLVPAPTGNAPFKGVTINVAVGSFNASGVKMFADQWEKSRGGKVNVTEIPFGDLYSKLFSAFSSHVNAYDVAIYASNWISGFAKSNYIIDLEPYYGQKDNWNTVLDQVKKLMYVKGKRYTVPMDGDMIMMYYRKDAFGHPEAASKFKSKYGYDLPVPPKTWKQYIDCAEFFTGWDWAGNGGHTYGVLEAMGPKDVGSYILTAHAAPYAANPKYPGTLFFDPDTMEPQVGNPGWVQAVDDWKRLKASGPPQMVTYGGGDMRGNFVAGNFALAIDWADTGILAQDPTQSKVKEKLGYAMAPAADRVWDYKQGSWTTPNEPSYAPYQGWGGWHASVTSTCENPEAAWDFANFLDSTENALNAVTTPGTARNPYRVEHFIPSAWTDAPVHFYEPATYLSAQLDSFKNPNAQLDLRIPEAGRYFDSLDNWVQQALAGSTSSESAMQQCAQEWKSITEKIGKASQQDYYKSLEK